MIDPGHGGSKTIGGSSPNNATGPAGTPEKAMTLTVGLRTRDLLEDRGHRVTMTRETDVNLGLTDRAKVAKDRQADAFVSIHFNGFGNPSVQGTETFHHRTVTPRSVALAEAVQTRLVAATGHRDRGAKPAGFGVIDPANHAASTAACLAEVSFLTDPVEEARLRDPAYLDRVADALASGVEDFLREAEQEPGPPSLNVIG